jgi:hypothetical protein
MDKDAYVERAIDLERRRWAEVHEALSERTAALSEEQRQIRAALVEYFSILQEWAHEEKANVERAAANHEPISRDTDRRFAHPGPPGSVEEFDDVRRSLAQNRRGQAKSKSGRFP